MSEPRKQYSAEEKLNILGQNLLEGMALSKVCERAGITPTMFYRWRQELFSSTAVFQRQGSSCTRPLEARIRVLENKVQQKNEVLAELMEEHLHLKKKLGVC